MIKGPRNENLHPEHITQITVIWRLIYAVNIYIFVAKHEASIPKWDILRINLPILPKCTPFHRHPAVERK